MAHHIETEALTKFYGRQRGIEELSLSAGPGEVFGFLGPNGAGKTTTIRLLMDLIRPTSGTIRVLGYDLRRDPVAARRRVGYLPGDLALYRDMSGRELLAFLARLRPGANLGYAGQLAGRLDLDLSRHVHDLSKGNKQKLGVVQALMHRPDLLILDEPSSGLDPLVQREFHACPGDRRRGRDGVLLLARAGRGAGAARPGAGVRGTGPGRAGLTARAWQDLRHRPLRPGSGPCGTPIPRETSSASPEKSAWRVEPALVRND